MSFETLLPIFAERLLKGGVDTYSIMLLGLGVGGLSGTVTLAWLGNLKNSPRFFCCLDPALAWPLPSLPR